MNRLIGSVALVALCTLSLALPFLAGKPSSNLPVTSSLEGIGPSPTSPYTIQSDWLGPYYNGVQSVESIIQGIGDWELDTGLYVPKPVRKIFVDLRDPVDGIGANRPFEYAVLVGRFIAKSVQVTSGGIRGMKGLGSYLLSPLAITFDFNGISYGLRMNPVNFPDTDFVLVTCTGVAGDPGDPNSPCNAWRMEPSTLYDEQPKGKAKLTTTTTVKGKTVVNDLGNFYTSFVITFTNP